MPCSCHNGGCGAPSRRGLLKWFVGALGGGLGVFLGWPLIGAIVGTIFRIPKTTFIKVGRMSDFPLGKPVQPKFEMPQHEEFLHGTILHEVWVIRHSADSATVFSPICPHLGCHYDWFASAEKFICPCHGSVFSPEGKVLGGPAPRGLDTLPHKVDRGELYVKWERFEVGITRKVRIG